MGEREDGEERERGRHKKKSSRKEKKKGTTANPESRSIYISMHHNPCLVHLLT